MSGEVETLLVRTLVASGFPEESLSFQIIEHGNSGDVIARVSTPVEAVVKAAAPTRIGVEGLRREIAALAWLDGRCGAARLIWSGEVEGRPAMLTSALPGVALHELPAERAEAGLVAGIEALARLHALSVAACPFDERLVVKLAEARRRLDLGETGPADWDPDGTGAPVEALWAEMKAMAPAEEDLVVTHGDASLPNFMVQGGRAGLIDLGRMGVGDRWCDLALFLRSAARNFPDIDAAALVERHYPITIDAKKVIFHQRLDRFS